MQLGGNADLDASLGKVLGPAFSRDQMPDIIAHLIDVYIERRHDQEPFIDTYRRIGITPFKERVYATDH